MAFYGQEQCQSTLGNGNNCTNKAYWRVGDRLLCGVHSKRHAQRVQLQKDPNRRAALARIYRDRQRRVEEVAEQNRLQGRRGNVICTKLRMRKEPEHHDGYLKVFPNYKHQHRKDGFGCASLSPMYMGPIEHGQPNLPDSRNLENFHQGNKVLSFEVDANGEPTQAFFDTQLDMYNDVVPHRHKEGARGNVPLYSIWVQPNGNRRKCTYFESRQFYCHFYEQHARASDDYQELLRKLENGYNLQIVGYDGYHVHTPLEVCYQDTSRPFGHELVLYTMLTMDGQQGEYPWVTHMDEELP